MVYDTRKVEGMPIGSGGIESANTFIGHLCLQHSGAWRVVDNGNGMLRLRCALDKGTFQGVIENHVRAELAGRGRTTR